MSAQISLFGREAPDFDPKLGGIVRTDLGQGAFVDRVPGWLRGHASLFETLRTTVKWRSDERKMYDRIVEVPRLYAGTGEHLERHAVIAAMRDVLDVHYETHFERITLAFYRDGRDSVAWHGDYVARRILADALVASVSLGAPRKFLLRPKGGGRSIAFSIGWGDLLVMGGSCQRTFEHAVPKVAHAGPRIALMFRPRFEEETPEGAKGPFAAQDSSDS